MKCEPFVALFVFLVMVSAGGSIPLWRLTSTSSIVFHAMCLNNVIRRYFQWSKVLASKWILMACAMALISRF